MAKVRNVSRVASTMVAVDGESIQVNAGFNGKVEDKFLHQYDVSAIHIVEGPKLAKPKPAKVEAPRPVIDAAVERDDTRGGHQKPNHYVPDDKSRDKK